jgi:ankyrin repeat protein
LALLSTSGVAAAEGDLRLVEAARAGDRDAVRALLAAKVDVDAPQPDGATALVWAAQRDDAETADLLIRAGADVNAANDYGVTPLSLACTNQSTAMVGKLLAAGANPNAALWSGETPIMTCARTGALDAVKALLARKADVNAKTRRAQTALMWAVAQKRPDVARALIEGGADVNIVSRRLEGLAPARYFTFGITESAYDRSFGPEAETHEDPHSSKGGFTALTFAARAGDLESARLLVAAGTNVNHASPEYGNALMVATVNGHEDVAMFLLEKGADPNVTDYWGFTPLHWALRDGIVAIGMPRAHLANDDQWIKPGMPALVKALLSQGANPNARVVKGLPPYNYLPFARDDINQMPYLRQAGATPFLLAAAATDVGSMKALVERGADPRVATEEGTTPVMVAAGLGKLWALSAEEEVLALEAVRLAVDLGVDVNAAMKDGRTALMGAAHVGANSVIQLLADRGADLDAKDKYGQTALGLAQNARAPNAPAARGNRRNFRSFSQAQGNSAQGPGAQKVTADLLLKLGATPLAPTR